MRPAVKSETRRAFERAASEAGAASVEFVASRGRHRVMVVARLADGRSVSLPVAGQLLRTDGTARAMQNAMAQLRREVRRLLS